MNNDLLVDLATGLTTIRHRMPERWKIHLIDTGSATQTGGRIERLREVVGDETFMCTYGDGVASISTGRRQRRITLETPELFDDAFGGGSGPKVVNSVADPTEVRPITVSAFSRR